METQIMIPSPATSSTTTPYATAPSSPHRFPTFFYSAPTSPIHHIQEDCQDTYNDSDFAFDFSGQIEPPSISAADELFHCGKIKPLNPFDSNDPPNPRYKKKKNFNSFIETFHQTVVQNQTTQNQPKRGRQTTTTTTTKISDILSDQDINQKNSITWYNKWNLKNLLLFRSASEGSATRRKMPVNKYSRITKCNEDAIKNSSFRSTDSCNSVRKVSAHEMHYTANRAAAEEMKRKTYLPYKSGLFGCLGFHNNGGSVHEISRGITTVMKQRGY